MKLQDFLIRSHIQLFNRKVGEIRIDIGDKNYATIVSPTPIKTSFRQKGNKWATMGRLHWFNTCFKSRRFLEAGSAAHWYASPP